MLERCHRIARFVGPGKTAFMESEALQDAVLRNIEVIGEAYKQASAETRSRLTGLDWRAICGMRDVLIHDYIGVDLDEVGNVASSSMTDLQTVLEQFLRDSGSAGPRPAQ